MTAERMTKTAAGHALVDWIGHQYHNEGTVPLEVALEIRASVVAIEAEATDRALAASRDVAKAAQAVLDWTEKERWAGPHDWLQHALIDWSGRYATASSGSDSTSVTDAASGSSSAASSSDEETA